MGEQMFLALLEVELQSVIPSLFCFHALIFFSEFSIVIFKKHVMKENKFII